MDESIIGSLNETVEVIVGDETINSSIQEDLVDPEIGDDYVENETYDVIVEPLDTTELAKEVTLQDVKNKLIDIDTSLNNMEISIGDVDLNTDELETKIDELKTLVSNLPTTLDGLNVNIENQLVDYATEETLLSINNYVDNIETLLADIKANQTNGNAKNLLVDLDGHIANIQSLTVQLDGQEYGIVTNAVIHGKTAQGNYVDIKANPSGALTVEATLANGVPNDIDNISNNTEEFGLNEVDNTSLTVNYVGKENKNGVWEIQKIDMNSGISVKYASVLNNVGITTFSTAWTNRETLNYDYYSIAN